MCDRISAVKSEEAQTAAMGTIRGGVAVGRRCIVLVNRGHRPHRNDTGCFFVPVTVAM
jgi:hypothetical protein